MGIHDDPMGINVENIKTLTSFEQCAEALRNPNMRSSLHDEGALLLERVVLSLYGSEHRNRRNAESKIFRRDFFHHYEREVLPRTLEQTLAPFVDRGKCNLVDLGYHIMVNTTADFTGIDRPERSSEETRHLIALLRTLVRATTLGQCNVADKGPIKAEIQTAIEEFDERFFAPSIERRQRLFEEVEREEKNEDDLPRDILTVLLEAEEKLDLTRYDFLREAAFFSLAGAVTSIHSLTHTLHDIFEWIDEHPEDSQRLRTDPFFLQLCVHESLRLNPSSPIAKRRPLKPTHVKSVGDVAETDELIIDLRAANRNQSVFGDDAEQFNPYREIPKSLHPYGLSMGMGAHACLGRNLAVGVVPKKGADPATHHYGTVPVILAELLKCGIRPDPDDSPSKDETIARYIWDYYPVVFAPERALL